MRRLTFKGGIHPHDGKKYSKNKPITPVLPGNELVFPLSQHIGAHATSLVAVGDNVLQGQLIAEQSGFVSSPIYSSVSGVVKAIEPRFTATGSKVNCIIVENDHEYRSVDYGLKQDMSELTNEEILSIIGKSGIVGMGGAGFPTKIKLSPKEPEKITHIIANCAECEPYITADYRRMIENTPELVEGMRIILKLFPNAIGVFAVEDNKMDCIKKIKELIKDEPRMKVKALKAKYPQGSERQLIYATTKKAINSGMLPADAGCIVDNVETLIAIHYAVNCGKPLFERIVTVSGDGINNPGNYRVLLGTNVTQLIEASGGFKGEPEKIISGGPMMGFAMFTIDVPIIKTTSSVLCLSKDVVAKKEASACINCGRCVEVCPSRIIPSRLANYAEQHDENSFLKWNGIECVECGSCSYICPAKRHLKQSIAAMKKSAARKEK